MNTVCVFCKKNEEDGLEHIMSEEHIIPEVLGGWIAVPTVCKKCNNTYGNQFESKLKKNGFIVTAIDQLKIQPPDKAYRHAKFEITFDDGHTVFAKKTPNGKHKMIPTKQDDDSLIVSEKDGKEILRKQIERFEKENNVKINFDIDFYDKAPYGIVIPIYGTDICFLKTKNKSTEVKVSQLTEYIPFIIPAKIAFVHLSAIYYPLVMDDCFNLIRESILNDDLYGKVVINSLLHMVKDPKDLEYKNFHYVRYSIIDNDLVAIVGLFSSLIFTVYLGNIEEIEIGENIKQFFNNYHVYELKNKTIFVDKPPQDIIDDHDTLLRGIQVLANYEISKRDE